MKIRIRNFEYILVEKHNIKSFLYHYLNFEIWDLYGNLFAIVEIYDKPWFLYKCNWIDKQYIFYYAYTLNRYKYYHLKNKVVGDTESLEYKICELVHKFTKGSDNC